MTITKVINIFYASSYSKLNLLSEQVRQVLCEFRLQFATSVV